MAHRICRITVLRIEGKSIDRFRFIVRAFHLDCLRDTGSFKQIVEFKGLDPLIRPSLEHASHISHNFLERRRARAIQSFVQAVKPSNNAFTEDIIISVLLPKSIIFHTAGPRIDIAFVVPMIRQCFYICKTKNGPNKKLKIDAAQRPYVVRSRRHPIIGVLWWLVCKGSNRGLGMVASSAIRADFSGTPVRDAEHSKTRGTVLEEEDILRLEIVMPCGPSLFSRGSHEIWIGSWSFREIMDPFDCPRHSTELFKEPKCLPFDKLVLLHVFAQVALCIRKQHVVPLILRPGRQMRDNMVMRVFPKLFQDG